MKTFVTRSQTNYGEVIHIINAENETEARNLANDDNEIWPGYEIEEIDTSTKGIVFTGGGGD